MRTVAFALMHARAAGLMLLSHLLRIHHDLYVYTTWKCFSYVVLVNGGDDIVTSKVVIFLMKPVLA